jgi:peptidyl-prolyl cis-trans isomerase B (cyclophilin B)|tara:strand:+ start:204 stop:761 length:558 start_codon:yes stop_codon:yes gene_type:complete
MFKKIIFILLFTFIINQSNAEENFMILKLKDGNVEIELYDDIAPNHVKRFKKLAEENKYDGVVFHRVIDGFMAQTGDVQYGNPTSEFFDLSRAGTGQSEYPNLKAEFSAIPHERGTLSMARSSDPDSANSQFFICFQAASHLDRQYSVFGKVVKGMEFVDLIKKGEGSNGEVSKPADTIISLKVK